MATYCNKDIDIDESVEKMLTMLERTAYFKAVRAFVEKDLMLFCHVNALGNNVLLDHSCDYRHYLCNLTLWEQTQVKDKDADLFETLGHKENQVESLRMVHLNELFAKMQRDLGENVHDVTDLFDLLERVRGDHTNTRRIVVCVKQFLQDQGNHSDKTIEFINKLIESTNEANRSFTFNKTNGVRFS